MSDMYDFESLRNSAHEIEENLVKSFAPKPKFAQDERFWKPKTNISGNIYAEIRFMPPFKKDGYSHITKYYHAWKNPDNKKNMYVECPKTYGKECPICEDVVRLWKENDDSTKAERSKKNKKTQYTSVIYVVKDPESPDNEGKFFFYNYGKTIYERIQEKLNPENKYEEKVNVFDIFNGCTLKLKGAPNEGGFMAYTKSEWQSPAPIKRDENELRELWKQYVDSGLDLSEFLDPSRVKTYDEVNEIYTRYENFGKSIENRVDYKSKEKQREFLGFDENDVNEIKTDTKMTLEETLDDSIPDFNDIKDIPDMPKDTTKDDVDDFISQLQL